MPDTDLILPPHFRGLGSSPGGDVVVHGRAVELAARFPSCRPRQDIARLASIADDGEGWEDWPPDECSTNHSGF